MPPAVEYDWTLKVHMQCAVETTEHPDGVTEELLLTGTESDMEDMLDLLKAHGLQIQTGPNTWVYYPNISKVDIVRSGI